MSPSDPLQTYTTRREDGRWCRPPEAYATPAEVKALKGSRTWPELAALLGIAGSESYLRALASGRSFVLREKYDGWVKVLAAAPSPLTEQEPDIDVPALLAHPERPRVEGEIVVVGEQRLAPREGITPEDAVEIIGLLQDLERERKSADAEPIEP